VQLAINQEVSNNMSQNVELLLGSAILKMAKDPYLITFFCLAMVCVATRIITGFRASMKTDAASGPQPIRVLAYWIPWIGHSFQFATKFQDFMAEAK